MHELSGDNAFVVGLRVNEDGDLSFAISDSVIEIRFAADEQPLALREVRAAEVDEAEFAPWEASFELPATGAALAHCRPKPANSDSGFVPGYRTPTAVKEDIVAQQTKGKSTRKSGGGRSKPHSSSSSTSKRTTKSRSTGQSRNGVKSLKDTVVDGTKASGRAAADVASKAKVPLIAGGAAIVGAAAGVVLKDRVGPSKSKNPLKRLDGMSMPKSVAKLDLDTVKSAADRVSAYGQQASDIAGVIEKTRQKNK